MNASRRILVLWYFLCLVDLLMLLEWLRGLNVDFPVFPGLRESVTGLLLARSGQTALSTGLSLWFLALIWVEVRNRAGFPQRGFWRSCTLSDACKTYLVVVSMLVFAVEWKSLPEFGNPQSFGLGIDQSTNVLVLLAGIVLSQTVALILNRSEGEGFWFGRATLFFFVLFLAATSFLHSNIPFEYKYRAQPRLSGLWVNPNIYGLLMAMGIVLAAGQFVQILVSKVQSRPDSESEMWRQDWLRRFKTVLCLAALGLMAFGLVKSYSRGAWLAAVAGFVYLVVHAGRSGRSASAVWVYRNAVTLTAIVLSIGTLSLWHFKETEKPVARRVFSVANANDFSWRNRLTAWEGALQMMAERPGFGFGWNQPEPAYEQYYRPAQVPDGLAIEMNDFFMLGTILGIPALAFFVLHVWLNLVRNAECGVQSAEMAELDWSRTICRAGVVVLLVGFWFDGGLFKMATATPFWILMEFGRRNRPMPACPQDTVEEGQTP